MSDVATRLDGLEKTQAAMLELLRGMGSEVHPNDAGSSTLSHEMEAALQHTIKDIRKAMEEKSSHEQAALLEAIRATLTGVHKREKKKSIHHDAKSYEDSIVLASYSPAEVVHRFASMDEPTPLDAPERDDFVGAVGFVDVSGFTKLSEKLQKEHGRKGAELLNKYVNAYFARLIDGINKYAGDVIKFAGDALQVVWRNRPDGSQDSAATLMLRASACCLYLLENLNGFSPSEGVSLTLHMGVGVGPMSAFYVGGEGKKWEYFVAGEPIEQMSDAAEEAVSGQLVISKASLGCFAVDSAAQEAYALQGKKLASEQYLLEGIRVAGGASAVPSFQKRSLLDGLRDSLTARGPELEPILRCFVPQLVEERLDAGQSGSAIHEHRKLVSVFMKVLGLGPKPCDVESLEIVHRATSATQRAIQKYDGTITRLLTDDKGTRFLIAFGLPGHQHDNDEERAVLSALEIVAALDRIPAWSEPDKPAGFLQCAIGITTGLVFCGEAGWARNRVEYTLAGAKVNLAARLMQQASKFIAAEPEKGGQVLCEAETYNPSKGCGCEWTSLDAVKVKGKEEPVPIFRPTRTSGLKRQKSSRLGGADGAMSARLSRADTTDRATAVEADRRRVEAIFGWRNALKTYGRAEEKAKIVGALRQLINRGKGSTLVIRGEAGMGKSHVLEELQALKAALQLDDTMGQRSRFTPTTAALTARSNEIERKTPFFMWKEIFERFFTPEFLAELAAKSASYQGGGTGGAAGPSMMRRGSAPFASGEGDAGASGGGGAHHHPHDDLPPAERKALARRRWRFAIETTIAFINPPGVVLPPGLLAPLQGPPVSCVIRPQVDAELMRNEQLLQHAPLLSPVLPEPIKDNQWTKQLSGEQRKEATISLMCNVLAAKLGGIRATLMFDDVHWMDSGSWALLQQAKSRVAPLLIVLTTRPAGHGAREIASLQPSVELELSELQKEDIDELVRNQLNVRGRVALDVSNMMKKSSGGNPLFVKNLITSCSEAKPPILDTSHDEVELVEGLDISQVEIPSSVETLITSRIDRLPVADQMLLKVAAVVACSGSFTEEQLPSMLRAGGLELPPGTSIRSILRSLRDAEMLSFDVNHSKPGNTAYGFKHASVQQVASSILSIELKAKLHLAAAQDCEQLYLLEQAEELEHGVAVSGELLRLLAYHWKRAGADAECAAKAVQFLKLAGDRALSQSAFDEASLQFEEALQTIADNPELPGLAAEEGPLQRRLGEYYMVKGEYGSAKPKLEQALVALGGEPGPLSSLPEKDVRVRLELLRVQAFRGQALDSVASPLRKLSRLVRGDDEPETIEGQPLGPPPTEGAPLATMELALAYELLSRCLMNEHLVQLASYCATRALQLGQSLEYLTPVVARAYSSLCLTAAADRRLREATRFKDLALSSCKLLGEQGLLSNTPTVAAVNEAAQGLWATAVANLQEAVTIADEIGDSWQLEEATTHMAHLEFYRGNFGTSRAKYETALAWGLERKDKKRASGCRAGIGAVLLATGDNQAAHEVLQSTNSYGQKALALLRLGQDAEAYAEALKVKDRFKGRRTKYYVLKAFVSAAEVFLTLYEKALKAEAGGGSRPEANGGGGGGGGGGGVGLGRSDVLLSKLGSPSSGLLATIGSSSAAAAAALTSRSSEADAPEHERFEDVGVETLQAMCQEWIDKLAQFSSVYAVANPRTLLNRGRLKVLSGSPGEGLKLMRKSQQLAAKMAMPYDEAVALAMLAKHTKASLKESQALRQEAQEIFVKLGVSGNFD